MERKLVSVQRIVDIEPIEGADKIVKATVLGWSCVTQKSNNFKPGDLVVYIEIDSMLPLDNPSFSWLRDKKKIGQTHHKLKTVRLRGQIAQGLILPLSAVEIIGAHGKITLAERTEFSNSFGDIPYEMYVSEGDDLTSYLGVTKYEPEVPAQLRGVVKGAWPFFLSKTDETRIQTVPGVLTRRKGELVYATEKVDGSSFTCWYYPYTTAVALGLPVWPEEVEQGYNFGVCSRNLNLARCEGNAFWAMVDKYTLDKKLVEYGKPLAIQGEMWGLGIQENKLHSKTVNLSVFNIFDLETKKYLDREAFNKVVSDLGLTPVPEVYPPFILDHSVQELVIMSMIKSSLNGDIWAEGIVVRPVIESTEKDLGRFSFKVINPEFSEKYD